MLFAALSNKPTKNDESSSDTIGSSSEISEDSDIISYQPAQTVKTIKRVRMPSGMVSSQTGVSIPAILLFFKKVTNNQMKINVDAANLIANSVVLRMMPILKNIINISKLRNFPLSGDDTYISSIPTIQFALLDAESNAISNKEQSECYESDPNLLKFVEDITINKDTLPLCLPPKIESFPEGIENIAPISERKKEITVTDLLSVLNDDKMTDPYKLQSSFATAYISRRRKEVKK